MKLYEDNPKLAPDEYWLTQAPWTKGPMLTRNAAEARYYHERGDNVQLVKLVPVVED